MYKTFTRNSVLTENDIIREDSYSGLYIRNTGTAPAVINDNIELAPGEAVDWSNDPGIIISEPTTVIFREVADTVKKILILKTYYS